MRRTVILAAVAVLAACGRDDSSATATSAAATTTASATTAAATSTTVDALEQNQYRNEFLDGYASHANCKSFECLTSDATYNRLEGLVVELGRVEVASSYSAVAWDAWDAWVVCLKSATTRLDCTDQEQSVEDALRDAYNALRS